MSAKTKKVSIASDDANSMDCSRTNTACDVTSASPPPSPPPRFLDNDDVTSLEESIANEMRLRGLKETSAEMILREQEFSRTVNGIKKPALKERSLKNVAKEEIVASRTSSEDIFVNGRNNDVAVSEDIFRMKTSEDNFISDRFLKSPDDGLMSDKSPMSPEDRLFRKSDFQNKEFDALVDSPDHVSEKFESLIAGQDFDGKESSLSDILNQDSASELEYENLKSHIEVLQTLNNENHVFVTKNEVVLSQEEFCRKIDGLSVDNQEGNTKNDQMDLLTDTQGRQKPDTTQIRLDLTPDVVNFKTKKFYESDDAILSQIFSQTISSAGATPTDDLSPASPRIVIDSPSEEEDLKILMKRGRPAFLSEDLGNEKETLSPSGTTNRSVRFDQLTNDNEFVDSLNEDLTNRETDVFSTIKNDSIDDDGLMRNQTVDKNLEQEFADDLQDFVANNHENVQNEEPISWITVEQATAPQLNENEFMNGYLNADKTESHEGSLTESQIQDDILDKSLDDYVMKTEEIDANRKGNDDISSEDACSRSFDENLDGFDEDTAIIDEILHSSSSFGMRDINRLEDLVSDMSNVIDQNLGMMHNNSDATAGVTNMIADVNKRCALERLVQTESSEITTTSTSTKSSSKTVSTTSASVVTSETKREDLVTSNMPIQNGGGDAQATPIKKKKKSKKGEEKENISVKSSFNKFDALQKKSLEHSKSGDVKSPDGVNGTATTDTNAVEKRCRLCSKPVFQMELVKAEKHFYHKNCFRCKDCNKQLTVDIYESHESQLYCKPHFRALFAPKVIEDDQPKVPRKHEMIIRENQPMELPPDVVRASDKPDLCLELSELTSLNVKSRYQMFEQQQQATSNEQTTQECVTVKRSPSILSKLAKFQRKGMDIGISDEALQGGVPYEESSEEEESDSDVDGDEIGPDGEDLVLVRARKRAARERPVSFGNMSDIKSRFEVSSASSHASGKEERREERKQEIQNIRSRLFMGKQAKIKEMYQQAVLESEQGITSSKKPPVVEICDKAKSIKERFEKGEAFNQDEDEEGYRNKEQEDMSVFDAGICKKSRSMFLELDANVSRQGGQVTTPSPSPRTPDVRKHQQQSASSPEREVYRDPEIIRSENSVSGEDPEIAEKSHTATKMLNIFRQMEEKKETQPQGPKPLKRFTPPPESPVQQSNGSGPGDQLSDNSAITDSESEEEDEVDDVRQCQDEALVQARNEARAKQLRAKFEKWESNEIKREQNNSSINLHEECNVEDSQLESAKSLRDRFESMREMTNQMNKSPRVKVNRFVEIQSNCAEYCDICEKKVYPLEKIDCNSKTYHKQCFRCVHCNAVLRMDTYTHNQGVLYCIPHFKQLFISKGNYETGFGLDQHKHKWEAQTKTTIATAQE